MNKFLSLFTYPLLLLVAYRTSGFGDEYPCFHHNSNLHCFFLLKFMANKLLQFQLVMVPDVHI